MQRFVEIPDRNDQVALGCGAQSGDLLIELRPLALLAKVNQLMGQKVGVFTVALQAGTEQFAVLFFRPGYCQQSERNCATWSSKSR